MRKKLYLGFCALVLFTIPSIAQKITVTGKVTDEKGVPIAGASVFQKGTKNGTTTNAEGLFSLSMKDKSNVVVSSIGFESKEVKPNEKLPIVLISESKTLSEIVVTGVGVATSKKKLAIEVAALNTKDVAKSAIGSVEQALMGKVAGAQVQFNSGTPGTGASIILRGLNSLGDAYPLIMLDGIEVSDLNGIDLGNIDRVEVVKGAAAGMLYGAQGGNGVIQIFTKRGTSSRKPQISFTSQVSHGSILRGKNSMIAQKHSFQTDANGYITSGGARLQPDANGSWGNPDFLDPNVDPLVTNSKSYKEQTYNHLDQAYSTATTYNNTINISGGGDKSDYSFTLSRYDEKNVLANAYNRTSIGSNIGFEIVKGLTFRNSLQTVFTSDNLLSGDADETIGGTSSNRFGLFNSFSYIDFKKRDPSGNLVVVANQGDNTTKNPLSETEWRSNETNRYRIIQNANINYKPIRFVEFDYKYGIEYNLTDNKNYYKNQANALQSGTAFWGQTVNGSIYNSLKKSLRQNSLLTAYIKTDFERDFNIKLPIKTVTQLTYDYRRSDYREYFAYGTQLPAFPPYNINVATNKTSGDNYSTFVTFGYLLNQSIDFGDFFGISAGFRSDYSSAFGGASKPFSFPRATTYLRLSELIKLPKVTEFKLRAAYGAAGIQPAAYDRQTTLSVQQLGNLSTIYNPYNLSNTNLKIQKAIETEIGTDITLRPGSKDWFSSIALSISYWNHKTEDVIQAASTALTSGASSIIDNLATLKSHGIDLSLDASVYQSKDFAWDFSARLGTTKSTVSSISNNKDIVSGFFTVRSGQQLGLFSFASPLNSLSQTRPDGSLYIDKANQSKYELVNGTVVDTSTRKALMTDATDAKTAGSAYPNFTASFTNTFSIKKLFTISFQFDWYQGNKIYNMVRQWLYRDRLSADFDKSITVNKQTGAYVNYYNSLYNSVSPSTWFVENGSFLRLRDISVTYNLPIKFLKTSSITFSGRNLLTITNYSGLDPEATTSSDAQGNTASGVGAIKGVDYFAVPNLKSYQLSLRIGL